MALIPVTAPRDNENQFVDRHKKGHSLNIMAVCGPNCDFFYLSARWPGSVNDARILRRSSLYASFEISGWRPFPDAVILGDSIYPCKEWLIPPIQGHAIGAQASYVQQSTKIDKSNCGAMF